jgi:predicted phosphate transport protein (TIGR00153 family)
MHFSLIPREQKFYDMFDEIAAMLVAASDSLAGLFERSGGVEQRTAELREFEHRCDEAVANLLKSLGRTFITPMDREDIHALATSLDTVLDNMEGVAYRVTALRMGQPTPRAIRLAEIIRQAVRAVEQAVHLCRDGLSSKEMEQTLCEIARLENDADDVYRSAVAELFAKPPDLLQLIKWKELYDWLENTADAARTVGHVITGIVAKGV